MWNETGKDLEPKDALSFAAEILFIRPGRTYLEILLQTGPEEREFNLPSLTLSPEQAWGTHEALVTGIERGLGLWEPRPRVKGILRLSPILLSERPLRAGKETSRQRVISLAVSGEPLLVKKLAGAKFGTGVLTWMTCPQFEAELQKQENTISDHVRILTALIWNKNYPLTMAPPFESHSSGGNEAAAI